MPVKVEDVTHGQGGSDAVVTHWVRPSSWVKELMRLFPVCLTGGFTETNDIALQFRSFWKAYKQFHPGHKIFSSNLNGSLLDRVIPLALFGDEGRGPKRGQFLIWSIESVLGVDDQPHDFKCKCSDGLASMPLVDALGCEDAGPTYFTSAEYERVCRQTVNYKNHSYITRHLLFGLPSYLMKAHPEVEEKHIQLLVDDLNYLFSTGAEVRGERWYVCVVGSKGDFKHQGKLGNLERSYYSIGRTYGNMMCSLCEAGAPGFPFETIEHEPLWVRSLHRARPWSTPPTISTLEFDDLKPEALLKLDLFHLWKVGLGRDLAGSGVITFCRIGMFDFPGCSKDLDGRLIYAHGSFKLWAMANHRTPGLQSFSKAFFVMKSYADSPWSNSKGADTVLLIQWLHWLVSLNLKTPVDGLDLQSYGRMLRLFKHTAEQSFGVMEVVYTHGLWLSRTCAKHLYGRLFLLLRGYRSLAAEALKFRFNAFGLKPKMHAIAHVAFELRQQLLAKRKRILNPLAWGCEQNEDTVGRVSRIARKVSVRTITKRVLDRYFLKKRALLKRKFSKQKRG